MNDARRGRGVDVFFPTARTTSARASADLHIGSPSVPHGVPFVASTLFLLLPGVTALLSFWLPRLPLVGVGPHVVLLLDENRHGVRVLRHHVHVGQPPLAPNGGSIGSALAVLLQLVPLFL